MRACVRTALLTVLASSPVPAQFAVPLPKPRSAEEVRREDYRRLFSAALTAPTRDLLRKGQTPGQFDTERNAFCQSYVTDDKDRKDCRETLTPEVARQWVGRRGPSITRVVLPARLPFFHPRASVANALRVSGASEGLTVFSRFAANVSDEEAYVATNVVRGLTGRAIFAIDYAAVVTKSEDEGTAAERKEAEDGKATLLRMINNGGTLVGRFQAPIHSTSGATMSSASAISFGAGVIGPIGQTDQLHSAGSVVGELMSSIPIRDLEGREEQTAELLLGARLGYSRSDASLLADGNDKGVGYGQIAIGLRRSGELSLSVLLTQAEKGFRDVVPKLVVNFSAIR